MKKTKTRNIRSLRNGIGCIECSGNSGPALTRIKALG